MSTFLGIPKEFPEIRIDYFKEQLGTLPPKACFLSHIHSDHLQGLDNYIGPVVYCSPATKKLLLRLEKKSVRLTRLCNEVEIEPQRMYRNLGPEYGRDVLRAIPYNTPTTIELDPCQTITVTLLEANHCPGSTMFLIENDNKAILYTGDIRAEDWWLESLRRNPILVPYTRGWKRLDCIYLDTTFCGPSMTYETFPSKTQGIGLLISEIRKYPKDTAFHFNAWTYGYEDLWIALASAFNVKIHVDKYRYEIFQSVGDASVYEYGPCLTGYSALSMDRCERMPLSEGCLTLDPNCTRFHSCERGYVCEGRAGSHVVYVHPTINSQIREPGAGYPRNGSGHEYRTKEEIDTNGDEALSCVLGRTYSDESLPATTAHPILSNTGEKLPSFIEIPYSRHSSYSESCNLVALFRPLDVYPCVVSEWMVTHPHALRELFGKYCFQNMYFFFDEIERFRYCRNELGVEDESNKKEDAKMDVVIRPARQKIRKTDQIRILEPVRTPGLQRRVSSPLTLSRKRKTPGVVVGIPPAQIALPNTVRRPQAQSANDLKSPPPHSDSLSKTPREYARHSTEWADEDSFLGLTSEISRRAASAVLEKGDETWFDITLFSTMEIGRDVFL